MTKLITTEELSKLSKICNFALSKGAALAMPGYYRKILNQEMTFDVSCRLICTLEKAKEVIKFYGDKNNWNQRWADHSSVPTISKDDWEYNCQASTGGKLAREFLKECE